jgi:hypothetical protein
LKQKGRSGRAKAGGKSERAKPELEGKLLPFFAFFFNLWFFFFFFFFFCLKRKRCQEKAFETEGQKWEGRSGSQK